MGTVMPAVAVIGGASNLIFGAAAGGMAGLTVAAIVLILLRERTKSSTAWRVFARKIWLPFISTMLFLGAWVGFTIAELEPNPDWFADVDHALLLLVIASGAWLAYAAAGLFGEPEILTNVKTGRDARRFRTQAQILRRVAQAGIIGLALILGLLTFPEARAPMVSILASAGLLSVVVGLAAQSSLGNMFAGLQLALTDAIRVGDTVILPGESQPGSIEEITLTYVVVRIWDDRRIILPSTEFTTKPFENWTRTEVDQLAVTMVELDWSAPIAEIRAEVGRLVEKSPLWDGRTWSVQVFTVGSASLEIRIVVSAANWALAWDLRSYVRENIVAWIMENAPWAAPRDHVSLASEHEGPYRWGTEDLDGAALSDPKYLGPSGGGAGPKWGEAKGDPDVALRQEDERLRRIPKEQSTNRASIKKREPLKFLGRFLFSGSEDGDRRAKIYSGPGQQVIEQRNNRIETNRREVDAIPITEE